MDKITKINFDSVDNSRILAKQKSNKLINIADSVAGIKNGISPKLSGSGASSLLSGAISKIEKGQTSCDSLSNLYDGIIELYKNADYSMSKTILNAFNQGLLLYELGFLTLDDMNNLYSKKLFMYDEKGSYIPVTDDMIENIYLSFPLMAVPLGGYIYNDEYIVKDPTTGAETRVIGDFSYRLQAAVNVLDDLGIHIPLSGGINRNHPNLSSLHRHGLASDFNTGYAININYNNGADEVMIKQYDKTRVPPSYVATVSANDVFYNTVDCSVEKLLEGKDYNRGLYAKVPDNIEIPDEYKKYVVNNLDNVVQSTNVLPSTPGKDNVTLVSIEGTFVDVQKIYKDSGLQMAEQTTDWPKKWPAYEAHHVEADLDFKYPKLYDDTGSRISDYDAKQYTEILTKLESLNK